jgi:hypothetical protein
MRSVVLPFLISTLVALRCAAQTNQTIYDDALQNAWENWSWATVNLNNAALVHGGTKSIIVTADAWEALYFHQSAFDPSLFTNLTFWIHGGTSGGQRLVVQAVSGATAVAAGQQLGPLTANTWQQVNVAMSTIVPPGQTQIDGIWIQDRTGTTQAAFYVDDVQLIAGPSGPPSTNTVASVRVDALANRKPIDPRIYGVAFASSNQLKELNVPLNRSGGNGTTRYNWQINAANHAADWYFESLASSSTAVGADGDDFVSESKAGGAQPMLTIPIIGWVAKLGPSRGRLSSYSIAKYGAQTDNDWQWFPDAGNGISSATGQAITNNNPNDANTAVGTNFQAGWVQHLTNRWGTAANGGLRYYLLDNEWGLWHSTHCDVHPIGATMDEVRDKFVDYATMIKNIDSNALVIGPEEWGWSGYLYSGYDLQWGGTHGWGGPLPDRVAHGGMDFLPWFLDQARQRSTAAGRRLLDAFTVHYYPQGGEFGSDVSTSMQLRRNRSTRSLWDTNYTDETWINDKVRLIPRLKQWAAQYYPGTPVGITEYNWGAENHINGATAQADVLGIFGREGLDLATRWVVPPTGSPAYKAYQMFRNYDSNKSVFGDTSVSATGPNPDNLAAFAASRSFDGALTVMVVNKVLSGTTPVLLSVTNFPSAGAAQVWQLTSANSINRLADTLIASNTVSNTLPAQSVTLFVLPAAVAAPRFRLGTNSPVGQMELWLDGQAGQSYVLQSSTNLSAWSSVSTNQMTSNSFRFLVPTTDASQKFYRGLVNSP